MVEQETNSQAAHSNDLKHSGPIVKLLVLFSLTDALSWKMGRTIEGIKDKKGNRLKGHFEKG